MPKLNKTFIEKLQPQDKEYTIYDEDISGFGVKVTKAGKKVYILKYRNIENRQRKGTIGVHGSELTAIQARETALDWKALLRRGVDPQTQKDKIKKELSFGDLFDRYLKDHAKPHKKSWWRDEEYYNRHIRSRFQNRKISTITYDELKELHHHIGHTEEHPSMANQIITLIGMVYNKAIEWGLFDGVPPSKFIKKYKEKSRDRFLQADEFPEFLKALNKEPNEIARDFIYALLFTGQRKSNVLAMRWEQIKESEGYWHIPETKNGQPILVPIVGAFKDVLQRRKNDKNKSEWVFPADSASGHLTDPKKAWKRILKEAKLEDLNMHDLRRTMGSMQTILGANQFVVAKSLGHKSLKSTQIYARLDMDPVRQSMEAATQKMMNMKAQDNV